VVKTKGSLPIRKITEATQWIVEMVVLTDKEGEDASENWWKKWRTKAGLFGHRSQHNALRKNSEEQRNQLPATAKDCTNLAGRASGTRIGLQPAGGKQTEKSTKWLVSSEYAGRNGEKYSLKAKHESEKKPLPNYTLIVQN